MEKFLFLDYFKFNSIRKLTRIFRSHTLNYCQLESFIDVGSLNLDSRSKNEVDKEFISNLKLMLKKYSEEQGFNSWKKFVSYCLNTASLIIVSNLFLMFLLLFVVSKVDLPSGGRVIMGSSFMIFSFISFHTIKDFYPLLILFNLIYNNNFILKVCYYSSVFLEPLILIFTLMLASMVICL